MSILITPSKAFRATGLALVAVLTLVIVAIPIAYLLRHSLVVMIGTRVLSPYGVTLQSVAGLQLGLNTISADSIHFVITNPDNNSLQQESGIEDARVTFAPRQLLQGRVQNIEIATLSLYGIPEGNTEAANTRAVEEQSTAATPTESALQLKAITAALQGLPLNSVSVESFSMSPYFSNATVAMTSDQREVSARIDGNDFTFSLQTNWHDTAFVSSYFIPDAELQGHVFPGDALTGAMRLYFRNELAASADFSLGESVNMLVADGSGELQLAVLAPFLHEHEMLADELTGLEGAIRFTAFVQEQPTPNAEQSLTFSLAVTNDSHASGPIPSIPGDANATFAWPAGQPLQITGSYSPQSQRLTLNAEDQSIGIAVRAQGVESQLALHLAEFSAQCTQGNICTARQSSSLQVPLVTSGGISLENLSAVTNATLTTSDSAFTVRLEQGSRIAADTIRSGTTTLNDVNLLVLETLTAELTATGDLRAESNGAELYLPAILSGDSSSSAVLKATDLRMHRSGEVDAEPEISATLQIRNLGSDLLPVILRKPEVDATLALANNSLQFESQARVADRTVLQFNGTHSLASGTGEGTLEVPALQFGSGQQSLSQFFFSSPYEADLLAGTLTATAQLRWDQNDAGQLLASGPISITAERLSGFYQDIALLELTTTVAGEMTDRQFISNDNLRLQIGSIDPGLPVENIALDYTINTANTTLEIRDVQAMMFNGTLSSTGLAFDWSAPENLFALAFDNIDLSRLLAMGAYEGINATGLVSGALPIRIAGSNVSVRGGTLQVQAPGGSISYQSATAGNTGNAALDLVNLALSNYQYDVMEAEVDYLPSGELILAVKLEGISPAVNNGQQINVNLNVTDNIPALLESLQASRNITDALQRELDER